MPTTTDKRIILSGVPIAWLLRIQSGDPQGSITELYRFDNLGEIQIKINISAEESKGENIDITRADGAIIRFPKFNLVLDGITEQDITPADASSNSTGKAEFVLKVNEAPLPTTITSFTAWLKDLKSKAKDLFLLVVPTGFTYNSRSQNKADGYIYCLVRLSSSLELTTNEKPNGISLTFQSARCTLSGVDATLIESATFTAITWKGRSASFTPPSLATGDGDILVSGDIIIKESATYTY